MRKSSRVLPGRGDLVSVEGLKFQETTSIWWKKKLVCVCWVVLMLIIVLGAAAAIVWVFLPDKPDEGPFDKEEADHEDTEPAVVDVNDEKEANIDGTRGSLSVAPDEDQGGVTPKIQGGVLRVCGDQLINMLKLICYTGQTRQKRDTEDYLNEKRLMSERNKRETTNLSTICCSRGCTLQQLLVAC
eukprot:GFUD01102402.1.p1 GENE.GFUD01102402.1~~GFUD01102402.1.p1  ORF type:complete len:186 (+),score=26.55 GFUD01102402.1:324-881(+)